MDGVQVVLNFGGRIVSNTVSMTQFEHWEMQRIIFLIQLVRIKLKSRLVLSYLESEGRENITENDNADIRARSRHFLHTGLYPQREENPYTS